jgi:hypothetical protein
MKIAQGKAAEAAALGKRPPHPASFFSSGLPRKHSGQTRRKKRGDHLGPATQGGARPSLVLGYYHIVPTGLQFGSLRSHVRRTTLITGGGPTTSNIKQRRNPAVQCMSPVSFDFLPPPELWPKRTS